MKNKEFYVLIEKDEDGSLVGTVSGLKGAYSYGRNFEELMLNIREVIELCLQDHNEAAESEFVGIQKIEVL